jgi:hypothetical protein
MDMREFYYDIMGKWQDVTQGKGGYAMINVLGYDVPIKVTAKLTESGESIDLLAKVKGGSISLFSKSTDFYTMKSSEKMASIDQLRSHIEAMKPKQKSEPELITHGNITIINYGTVNIYG